jgi:hypothetical protein
MDAVQERPCIASGHAADRDATAGTEQWVTVFEASKPRKIGGKVGELLRMGCGPAGE